MKKQRVTDKADSHGMRECCSRKTMGRKLWVWGAFALLLVALLLCLPACHEVGEVPDVEEISPIDHEASQRIDAMEGYDPSDTWTFYLYMVGSNLESGTSNQLSSVVKDMVGDISAQNLSQNKLENKERLLRFVAELEAKGLELPYNLFAPESDLTPLPADNAAPFVRGEATRDLLEYMSVPLPENVRFVIQTGGSNAWANPTFNPNRTQRFLLDSQGLKEIYNGPVSNMGDPKTLEEFLKFGAEEYPADHEALILWNHGGGDTGFGHDEIFEDSLSLSELNQAFSAAFPPDKDDPPLELIYFACCLMSNAEALDYMEGVCRYMVAAEEVTYTVPNACAGWLEKFVKNTGINGAQLGKLMVESYIDSVANIMRDTGTLLCTSYSLLDMEKASEVYDAYAVFARAALQAQIENPLMIEAIAEAASASDFMASVSYYYNNLVDLTLFMEKAAEFFPEEAQAVIDAVEAAVLYKRATSYIKDSGGISVYYPYHLSTAKSYSKCLSYLEKVSKHMDISAMYYYKIAGCLNDTYQEYCDGEGFGTAWVLPYDQLHTLRNAKTEIDKEGNLSIALSEMEDFLIQDAVLELMELKDGRIFYLGADRYVNTEGTTLKTDFPLAWISISGVPFALEVVNTDEESIQYCSFVVHNSRPQYLLFSYSFETEKVTILGLREDVQKDTVLDRHAIPLKLGEKITPLYKVTDTMGGTVKYTEGPEVVYRSANVVADAPLQDGVYIIRIKMEDMRSDRYCTFPVRLTVKNGKVTSAAEERECFLPSSY